MPHLRNKNGKARWRATIMVEGRSKEKLFPDATKQSYRAAVQWEEETRKKLLEKVIDTEFLTLGTLAENYLDHAKERFDNRRYRERKFLFRRFFSLVDRNLTLEQFHTADAFKYLAKQNSTRSGHAANKDRKFLSASWEWGKKYMRGFPQFTPNPFRSVDKFPEKRQPRYVPSEQDFEKVFALTEEQDKVMLMAFLHLAARKGELFSLTWSDVDFSNNTVRLWTQKRERGDREFDLLPLTDELRATLMDWWQERPIKETPYVFVVCDENSVKAPYYGQPFKHRYQFMRKLCKRANVMPFTYHAIRHLSASILYRKGYDVRKIQTILRHKNLTTTLRYLKTLGIEDVRPILNEAFSSKSKVIPFPEKIVADV